MFFGFAYVQSISKMKSFLTMRRRRKDLLRRMKKIFLFVVCLILAVNLNAFAKSELVIDAADVDEIEENSYGIALLEYSNGITITSDGSTISKANGTLQLTAQISQPLTEESIIWSIESGKNFATIDQNGLLTAVTNGVVVCKAKSTVDESRFAYKTVTIAIKTESQYAHLEMYGVGGCAISGTQNGATKYWGSVSASDYPIGDEFELKAVPKNNKEFLYWSTNDGKIVSYNDTYKFTLGTDLKLRAVCADVSDTKRQIIFRDLSGKILAEGPTTSEITVPSNPYAIGYEFLCWVADGKRYELTAGSKLDGNIVNKNTIFAAGYVKSTVKYDLTAIGADISSGSYCYNDLVSLNHLEPEKNKKFSYWKRDGKIVSYSDTYNFYMGTYSTVVEAVFTDIDEPIAEVPLIAMSEPMIIEGNKISFTAERYLPQQYKLIATGIVLDKSSASVTLETYGAINSMATSTENIGQYTVRKKDVSSGDTWFARGYMIYADGDDIMTIYSDTVSKKMN